MSTGADEQVRDSFDDFEFLESVDQGWLEWTAGTDAKICQAKRHLLIGLTYTLTDKGKARLAELRRAAGVTASNDSPWTLASVRNPPKTGRYLAVAREYGNKAQRVVVDAHYHPRDGWLVSLPGTGEPSHWMTLPELPNETGA